jgi:hypothetical protein
VYLSLWDGHEFQSLSVVSYFDVLLSDTWAGRRVVFIEHSYVAKIITQILLISPPSHSLT